MICRHGLVVMVTSHSDANTVKRVASLGASGYILKPIEANRVTEVLHSLLAEPSPQAPDNDRPKVLVVDPDLNTRCLLRRVIAESGYATAGEVETVAEAREFLQHTMPDLVVIDLGLPDAETFDSLATVGGRQVRVPLIATCAENDRRHVEMARQMGAEGYLLKPFTANRATAALKRALAPFASRQVVVSE